jgi:hypothetical protein
MSQSSWREAANEHLLLFALHRLVLRKRVQIGDNLCVDEK